MRVQGANSQFIMRGGKIYNNEVTLTGGGGVVVDSGATFIMEVEYGLVV